MYDGLELMLQATRLQLQQASGYRLQATAYRIQHLQVRFTAQCPASITAQRQIALLAVFLRSAFTTPSVKFTFMYRKAYQARN